jgi:hypothetical protein
VAALDRVKEELAYLRFWQGVTVVTDISLIGWLVSTNDESFFRTRLAMTAIAVLTLTVFRLHRLINRLIARAGRL